MIRPNKVAIFILAGGAALVAGAVLMGVGLVLGVVFANRCTNDPLVEYPSPDGALKVVVFQRVCGTNTMAIATDVSLLHTGQRLPDGEGNLFAADTNSFAAPLGPGGGPIVRVKWEGKASVLVEHDHRARILRSEKALWGVSVRSTQF